jgi:release factor glutamine methyltransferase
MRRVNALELVDRAVQTLHASTALDHWQSDRDQIESEELLEFALGHEPDPEEEVSTVAARRFDRMIERRATGEPVAFIKGYAEFRGLELIAKPGVFVPRDSSEFLAEQAIRRLRRRSDPVAVDLATGAGTVALAIANEVPRATVFGADVADDAVALARRNARRLGLGAGFVVGDLFDALPARLRGTVDVITLHPPYVGLDELEELPDEIRNFEPTHTLTDRSRDGLGLVERAADEAWGWLCRSGWLLIEVSPDRSRTVASILRGEGFADVRSTKGGMGVTRVVVGRAAT